MNIATRSILTLVLAFTATSTRAQTSWNPTPMQAFAKIQRDGKPYSAFYNYYICPHAVDEAGKVFCTYQDGNGRPIVMAYSAAAKTWAGPVRTTIRRRTHARRTRGVR
ncbi:MAG: hypothetical protein HQ567_21145 [Candidatus Nealsonbacteria bacterium]|nr:hypothetical protein [Candidatus Nealsonbacteria bacterium]